MDAMKDFLIRWLVLTVAAAVMVVLLPGMTAVGQPPILGIAVFALFMALISAGSVTMQVKTGIPVSFTSVLEALIVLFILLGMAVSAAQSKRKKVG